MKLKELNTLLKSSKGKKQETKREPSVQDLIDQLNAAGGKK